METVTFIVEADIRTKDSGGHESIHFCWGCFNNDALEGCDSAEVSSEIFKKMVGELGLQAMVKPSCLKNDEPGIWIQEQE